MVELEVPVEALAVEARALMNSTLGVMEDSHCIALHTLGVMALEVVVEAVAVEAVAALALAVAALPDSF